MRKQDLIEMVVPIIGLVLMFVLLFVIGLHINLWCQWQATFL